MQSPDRSLRVIEEDEEALEEVDEHEDGEEDKKRDQIFEHGDEAHDAGTKEQGLTEEELAVLSKLRVNEAFISNFQRTAKCM